jgi:hypothetical protein
MYELSKHEIENIANSTEYNDTMDIDTLPVYALPI